MHVLIESDKISAYMQSFLPDFPHLFATNAYERKQKSLMSPYDVFAFFGMNIFCKISSVLFL